MITNRKKFLFFLKKTLLLSMHPTEHLMLNDDPYFPYLFGSKESIIQHISIVNKSDSLGDAQ